MSLKLLLCRLEEDVYDVAIFKKSPNLEKFTNK